MKAEYEPEKTIIDMLAQMMYSDPHFGTRTKSHFPLVRYNSVGRLWEVRWHYEYSRAKRITGWLHIMRGVFTNKIRGFQIWWPPLRFGRLIYKR